MSAWSRSSGSPRRARRTAVAHDPEKPAPDVIRDGTGFRTRSRAKENQFLRYRRRLMSLELYLVFVLASALLIATPGPNVALIVGTSLRYGARSGLTTVAGVNFGLTLQLAAVALGLTWIVELFARHFDLIRYAGAFYLAVLGLQQLFARSKDEGGEPVALRGDRAFARGFAVAF